MTLEELKSLRPGDVVVITKVDEYLNNGTTSKDYYVGEEMTFLICMMQIILEMNWVK